MIRFIVYLALSVTSGVASFFISNSTVVSMTTGFSIGMLLPVVEELGRNGERIRHIWYSLRYRNRPIRISAAYLFRILVDGKYLLIRGSRYQNQFQPVGGVYKVTREGSTALAAMGAMGDNLIPVDPSSNMDIRVRVLGRNLVSFFRWFDSRNGREDSPWREFQEELISSSILPAATFPYIVHNYIRREVDKVRYSPYSNSLEILVADIYELVPNRDQEDAFRLLASTGHPDIQWVTAQQIKHRGATLGQPQTIEIAAHSQRLL